MIYYFPTIKWVGQLNGIVFLDIGATWNQYDSIPDISNNENWAFRESINDNETGWVMSYGFWPQVHFIWLTTSNQLCMAI